MVMKLSAAGVTFLSGRNCDFSIEEEHGFAARSSTWPGDGSIAQAFAGAATMDQRLTPRGSATTLPPIALGEHTRVLTLDGVLCRLQVLIIVGNDPRAPAGERTRNAPAHLT